MTHEIELKFGIPQKKQAALKKRLATRTAISQRLCAYYFDTPEGTLSQAKVAVRVRQEDDVWVQTIKTKGDGIATRGEENVELAFTNPKKSDIKPDLSLFSTDTQTTLSAIAPLEELQAALSIQYSTEVTRTSRIIKRLGSVVEISYDDGKVVAGRKSTPLTEVEFELLSGSLDFLIQTACTWVESFGLYMLSISKAERGKRLQSGEAFAKAVKSDLKTIHLNKDISQVEFLQVVIANCLQHMLPNLSEIALGSDDPNHVHQARVGMRRLRTALSSFASFAAHIDEETLQVWRDQLKYTFGLLGESRDLYILQSKTQPALEQQGAPVIDWQHTIEVTPCEAVKQSAFQLSLLELVRFSQKPTSYDARSAKQALSIMLDKLFNKISKDSSRFATLANEDKHEVRKRLKKLRYIAEFANPLYSDKKMGKFFNYLEPAQELLGEFNDAAVGHEKYLALVETNPKAWFAVGWFTAREESFAKECALSLQAVKNAPTFW